MPSWIVLDYWRYQHFFQMPVIPHAAATSLHFNDKKCWKVKLILSSREQNHFLFRWDFINPSYCKLLANSISWLRKRKQIQKLLQIILPVRNFQMVSSLENEIFVNRMIMNLLVMLDEGNIRIKCNRVISFCNQLSRHNQQRGSLITTPHCYHSLQRFIVWVVSGRIYTYLGNY